MIRMTIRNTASDTKSYYFGTPADLVDYYSEDQQLIGHWGGRGAAALGLSGTVDQKRFNALADNVHPVTGESLTARTKATRTVGYDLNFHPPKSVSLVQAWTQDARIVAAFRAAVAETMAEIEREARTRVRLKGHTDTNRLTGNLIWAEFIHFTARPVNGVPDPHMHAHCLVFNATFDEAEQRWKAGQFREINARMPYYQAAFHNRLAHKLQELGYAIEKKEKSFEIQGVPESANRKFSQRTAQVEKTAKEKGITDKAAKSELGALTREAKRTDFSLAELRKLWDARLTKDERTALNAFLKVKNRVLSPERTAAGTPLPAPAPRPVLTGPPGQAELTAVEYAILHSFERASAVEDWRLLEAALRFGMGQVDVERLNRALLQREDLIRKIVDGRQMITTKTVLAEERAMVAWVKAGKDSRLPLAPGHVIEDPRLNDEQREAIRHVLNSQDRVTGIKGKAGTGKTTLMREAIGAIRGQGQKALVMAPGSETARDTLPKDGFADACTLALLLSDPKLQDENRGGVWWVDEAGLLSSRTMARLCDLAKQFDARLVLSGDPLQHRAVERGDALRILEQYAGLPMATLGKVLRQSGLYREAVEHLSKGELAAGFDKLDEMGAIVEVEGPERHQALAREYLTAVKAKETVLVVSPTHAEGRTVTEVIREQLKQSGDLTKERPVPVLRRVDLSEAERSDARLYRTGWTVEFVQGVRGHRAGDRCEVVGTNDGTLQLRGADGKETAFTPAGKADRFDVFEKEVLPIAKGDRIRITKNGRSTDRRYRLLNGTLHTVEGFTESGDLRLSSGKVVSKEFAHLTHGYATTSHSAQSKTVDTVFIAESAESSLAANREQIYVSVSRGKKGVRVFTDNREALLEAVHASSQRVAALDIVGPDPERRDGVFEIPEQRGEPIPATRHLGRLPKVPERMPIEPPEKGDEPELEP